MIESSDAQTEEIGTINTYDNEHPGLGLDEHLLSGVRIAMVFQSCFPIPDEKKSHHPKRKF